MNKQWLLLSFSFVPSPILRGDGARAKILTQQRNGKFYLRGEIPVSVSSAREAALHAERKEAFHSLPTHVLPASGSSRAMSETLGELG